MKKSGCINNALMCVMSLHAHVGVGVCVTEKRKGERAD